MRIDKRLNLVIPITDEDEKTIAYVHSTPISSDVFDTYFLPIAKTFSEIYSEGLGFAGGPRVADKMLRKVSQDLGVWEGPAGVQNGLIAEIHQRTNVLAVGKNGWEMLPFHIAKKTVLNAEDASEVEAALIFFTCGSVMFRKSQVADMMGGAMKLWGAQIGSWSCTDYMNSLPTSTESASSGATAAA